MYLMQTNYTECLCAASSLHLAVILPASCKMRPQGCEALAHEEKTFICPVFQGLLSFSQHVWFLWGPVSLGFSPDITEEHNLFSCFSLVY